MSKRVWRWALPVVLPALALAGTTGSARAAAEVHKLNLVISAIPTSVAGGDFNDQIDKFNRTVLNTRGDESLDKIGTGWLFDAELRYFLRPNVAVSLGVGQLRATTKREYLPGLQQDITLYGDMLAAPVHLGGDYYFTPYNQGDFRAQGYVGAGLLSLTSARSVLQRIEINTTPDSTGLGGGTSQGGTFKLTQSGDAPGYYLEAGFHLFFAMRYSVMLGAIFRSAEVHDAHVFYQDRFGVERPVASNSAPITLDFGGIGARAALGIGF